jgi:hypothetical protein
MLKVGSQISSDDEGQRGGGATPQTLCSSRRLAPPSQVLVLEREAIWPRGNVRFPPIADIYRVRFRSRKAERHRQRAYRPALSPCAHASDRATVSFATLEHREPHVRCNKLRLWPTLKGMIAL